MEWIKKHAKNYPILIKFYRMLDRDAFFKKSVTKKIKGKGNKLRISSSTLFIKCRINVKGNNNHITIHDTCVFNNVLFNIKGNNNRIEISKNVIYNYGGEIWIEDDDCNLIIGENTSFENTHIAVTELGSKVVIGKDCMFAYDIDIRTGDSHSIIDTNTNQRINYAKNIEIGDHVWVAAHVTILKGVCLMKNSIVATRSLVSSTFHEEGIIVGGVPAKKIKDNITWCRERINA
jgi:acetyltransferase-like isoleucine patch superfamily enzyme